MTRTNMSIPEALDAFAVECRRSLQFRQMCCARWRRFRDDHIGDDIADYAKEVFGEIGQTPDAEQLEAMRSFPPEPLRLLRSFVVQFLDCPRPEPTPLNVRYEGIEDARRSITIRIDEENEATVTFRAPRIP